MPPEISQFPNEYWFLLSWKDGVDWFISRYHQHPPCQLLLTFLQLTYPTRSRVTQVWQCDGGSIRANFCVTYFLWSAPNNAKVQKSPWNVKTNQIGTIFVYIVWTEPTLLRMNFSVKLSSSVFHFMVCFTLCVSLTIDLIALYSCI